MSALRIGLTGGIGSGKSTVARMLATLGAHVVDTDALARALTAPGGAAIPAIRAAFGSEMITPDGALDRAAMRQRVFTHPEAKRQLEAILHPQIQAATQQAQTLAAPGQVVVLDVPLLVESAAHWLGQVDRVLVVACEPEVQIRRVVQRSGWPEAQVKQVIAAQATPEQRQAVADAIIDNSQMSLPALAHRVWHIWHSWIHTTALPDSAQHSA
jgi:dephospho-CoA kinase